MLGSVSLVFNQTGTKLWWANVYTPGAQISCNAHSHIPQSLRWRQNGCDGVSNHQPHDCLPDQSKHQSSASLAFVWVIHRSPVNSPHKWPVTRKMFPFDDGIMMRIPDVCIFLLQNAALWDSFVMHCGICELGILDGFTGKDKVKRPGFAASCLCGWHRGLIACLLQVGMMWSWNLFSVYIMCGYD